MASAISPSVEKKLQRVFNPENWDEARGILLQYGQKEWQLEVERVHFAVLWLCEGSISELKHYMGAAMIRFREVLNWAEHPHSKLSPDEKKYDHARTYIQWLEK